MSTHTDGSPWKWMAAAVLVHLTISMVHGAAHNGAHILMSPAATLFVFVVILTGPLIGLALSWRSEWLGSVIVALTRLVIRVGERLESIFVFSIDGDTVSGIRIVRNPDKLAHIYRRLMVH